MLGSGTSSASQQNFRLPLKSHRRIKSDVQNVLIKTMSTMTGTRRQTLATTTNSTTFEGDFDFSKKTDEVMKKNKISVRKAHFAKSK